ncbi:proto-oncogene tyrosine-protein kinase ROS-like isoform X2 [Camponotus floridanus]|uniref:proto-oncogene tyrosine-protein kinase ROS-like isoform X2 n=1 Tax=Camponotus floridanus TaxID=104421 RepID=UPI000DC66689|nr:proto-oncogene tyrosine-protein kinase ROS-like isoform X2 [Camponotus floridanus]
MQIIFGTILCILSKDLILTRATITFMLKNYISSNSLQKINVSMYADLNFTQFMKDISMSDKNDHHILNFKSDSSHSDDMTMRSEGEVGEVPPANIPITPEPIKNSLSKPTSLRAFVQFDNEFTKNDIFVTLRWNQPDFTDEPIQGYTVKCFIENLQEIQIYDDKNITTTKLEHMVNNLKPNTTYYFRVCAHTKVVAGPYADIRVSTIHENPIPKLLIHTVDGFEIWDLDSNITKFVSMEYGFTYSIQEQKIYWYNDKHDLMTMEINENNITKMASYDKDLYGLCIDWVARNLYFISNNDENSG